MVHIEEAEFKHLVYYSRRAAIVMGLRETSSAFLSFSVFDLRLVHQSIDPGKKPHPRNSTVKG
jgi:hypothetical protein